MNIFDKLVDYMDRGEHSFVTFLSKLIPLLVPLIPAYVSYNHVVTELRFHWVFGIAYGAVVEGLGYASIYKAVQFWEWNRHYTKKENKLPILLVVGIYVAYLIVILWVNVMLDWQSGVVWFRVVAVALISLLSVPAGLLLSVSAIHTEHILHRRELANERKTNKPNEHRTNRTHRTNKRTNAPNEQRTKIEKFVRSTQANEHRTPGPSEISRSVGVAKSYASETLQIILNEEHTQ